MDFLTPACATRSLGPANTLINTFLSTMIAIHCNISTTQTWPKDYGEHALAYGEPILYKKNFCHVDKSTSPYYYERKR